MKKLFAFCLTAVIAVATANAASPIDAEQITTYHRSSLIVMPFVHMQDSFAVEIADAALRMPFPDRYDQLQYFDNRADWIIKLDDHCNYKQAKDTTAYHTYDAALNHADMAKHIVAAWFNYSPEKGFNTDYIAQKGNYDASVLAQEMASGTISGAVNLADASDELIGKTFILVNDMAYIDHAARAEVVNIVTEAIQQGSQQVGQAAGEIAEATEGLGILGSFISLGATAVQLGANVTELAAGLVQSTNQLLNIEGFAVLECTYLYQLDWNEEVQNTFYNLYYNENGDSAKLAAFWADSTTFRMKYVGMMPTTTNNATAFHAGKYAKLSQEEQITITCSRTQDDAINNLQTKYEDFRVYTPITEIVTNPKGKTTAFVAPIGQKEGVAKNKKYDLMQQIQTKEGRTQYVLVEHNVKPDGEIWDNRYAVSEESEEETDAQPAEGETPQVKGTSFKSKKAMPGMLLIESGKKQKSK